MMNIQLWLMCEKVVFCHGEKPLNPLRQKPQNYISLTDEGDLKNMQKLIDMLEDNDDVQNVWHTWENE